MPRAKRACVGLGARGATVACRNVIHDLTCDAAPFRPLPVTDIL